MQLVLEFSRKKVAQNIAQYNIACNAKLLSQVVEEVELTSTFCNLLQLSQQLVVCDFGCCNISCNLSFH